MKRYKRSLDLIRRWVGRAVRHFSSFFPLSPFHTPLSVEKLKIETIIDMRPDPLLLDEQGWSSRSCRKSSTRRRRGRRRWRQSTAGAGADDSVGGDVNGSYKKRAKIRVHKARNVGNKTRGEKKREQIVVGKCRSRINCPSPYKKQLLFQCFPRATYGKSCTASVPCMNHQPLIWRRSMFGPTDPLPQ